ncbi:MAG: hypothetical protein IPN13_17210 [Bacteroidetes bacterium]|nr:hypothetical protein [Bacteroidota bacterium]
MKAHIEKWDFSAIKWIGAEEILEDKFAKPILFEWFNVDPGPPPQSSVPDEIQNEELVYVQELFFGL